MKPSRVYQKSRKAAARKGTLVQARNPEEARAIDEIRKTIAGMGSGVASITDVVNRLPASIPRTERLRSLVWDVIGEPTAPKRKAAPKRPQNPEKLISDQEQKIFAALRKGRPVGEVMREFGQNRRAVVRAFHNALYVMEKKRRPPTPEALDAFIEQNPLAREAAALGKPSVRAAAVPQPEPKTKPAPRPRKKAQPAKKKRPPLKPRPSNTPSPGPPVSKQDYLLERVVAIRKDLPGIPPQRIAAMLKAEGIPATYVGIRRRIMSAKKRGLLGKGQ